MAPKKRTKTSTKQKKKNWYVVIAPDLLGGGEVGEVLAVTGSDLIGKHVEYNLMHLIRDPKKQHILVKFKINDFKDNRAYTEIVQYKIMPASIKRFVRRGKDRIDDSVYFRTTDKKIVQIKPFITTRSNTTRAVLSDIRKSIRDFIAHYLQRHNYSALVKDIISGKFQAQIRQLVKKIYPVNTVEIRVMKLVDASRRIKSVYEVKESPSQVQGRRRVNRKQQKTVKK